jgi:hypothetical protein
VHVSALLPFANCTALGLYPSDGSQHGRDLRVTARATSLADTTKSASASVTVSAPNGFGGASAPSCWRTAATRIWLLPRCCTIPWGLCASAPTANRRILRTTNLRLNLILGGYAAPWWSPIATVIKRVLEDRAGFRPTRDRGNRAQHVRRTLAYCAGHSCSGRTLSCN